VPDSKAITIELLRNELLSVKDAIVISVRKTGHSALVKLGDFGCGICDAQGQLLGITGGSPTQMPVFMELMSHVVARSDEFVPGDVLMTNDPAVGIGHLPDLAVISPVFFDGHIVAYTVLYSHHTDIGGRFPGGMSSQCHSAFEEGLHIPLTFVVRGGKRQEEVLNLISSNVRTADKWRGDLDAKLVGCWESDRRITSLLEKYGVDTFDSCCSYLLQRSEDEAREVIAGLPDGSYTQKAHYEEAGEFETESVELVVTLHVSGDEMVVDFAGTSAQVATAINVPFGQTCGGALAAVMLLMPKDALLNSGLTRAVRVEAPRGSVLHPLFPAPVGGRGPLLMALIDVVFRALALVDPDRVAVSGEGGDLIHFSRREEHAEDPPDQGHGDAREFMDIFFGGWGATPTRDGPDGVANLSMGTYSTMSAEMLEQRSPVVVEEFGMVADTEGPGTYRGSLGIRRGWRFLEEGSLLIRTINPVAPPGLVGGGNGCAAESVLFRSAGEEVVLPRQAHVHLDVKAGDVVTHMVGGAGGYGYAWKRDPALVMADIENEKISMGHARDCYGIVLTANGDLDETATAALRQTMQELVASK
jgi:N-methylhydantoinase B